MCVIKRRMVIMQNDFRQNPLQGYCAFIVAPKVAKFRKTFADKMKAG